MFFSIPFLWYTRIGAIFFFDEERLCVCMEFWIDSGVVGETGTLCGTLSRFSSLRCGLVFLGGEGDVGKVVTSRFVRICLLCFAVFLFLALGGWRWVLVGHDHMIWILHLGSCVLSDLILPLFFLQIFSVTVVSLIVFYERNEETVVWFWTSK